MAEGKQFRKRFNPRINSLIESLSATKGFDEADFLALLMCQQAMKDDKLECEPIFRESSKEIREILLRKVEQAYMDGITKRGMDLEKWVSECIEDARAEAAEKKQEQGERYFVKLKGRTVGPHRLDKLREWVHAGVLGEEVLCVGVKSKSTCAIGDLPNFSEYPATLRRKLSVQKEKKDWMSRLATENQVRRLDFFKIPYDKDGLTQGRAHELITHFNFLDPEREKQWNLVEKGK
jgi:hypothetical protein